MTGRLVMSGGYWGLPWLSKAGVAHLSPAKSASAPGNDNRCG
jgi:hypothetical protein